MSEQSCSFFGYFSEPISWAFVPHFPDVEAGITVYYCDFKSLQRLMSRSVGFCDAYERYCELRAPAGTRQGFIKQGLSICTPPHCSALCPHS